MNKPVTLSVNVEPGADLDDVMAKLCAIPGVTAVLDVSAQLAVTEQLAKLETWDERCAREAVEEHGLTDASEIEEHMDAAQSDLDYLTSQDEALERLVHEARDARGTGRERSEIIADALKDAGVDLEGETDHEPF